MQLEVSFAPEDVCSWICPNITAYWTLGQRRDSNQVILQAVEGNRRYLFSAPEGYALRYFTGQFTVEQVQAFCQQKFGDSAALLQADRLPPDLVVELLQKLVTLEILALPENKNQESPSLDPKSTPSEPLLRGGQNPKSASPRLKPVVQWIQHPDGYWLLRNPEVVTFLQVSDRDKAIIEQLGYQPLAVLTQAYNRPLAKVVAGVI